MNDLMWFLYSLDVVDGFRDILAFLLFTSSLATALLLGLYIFAKLINDPAPIPTIRPYLKLSTIVLIVSLILAIVTPTKETLILMGGAKVGADIVNSDTGKKVQEIIQLELDKQLKQLKEHK